MVTAHMGAAMKLFVCSRGHRSPDADQHDVCERVHSVDRPIYRAFIEYSCVECGSLVDEVAGCEMCADAPAASGSDRCESCDIQVAAEEAAEELAAQKRADELRNTLVSIALTPWMEAV